MRVQGASGAITSSLKQLIHHSEHVDAAASPRSLSCTVRIDHDMECMRLGRGVDLERLTEGGADAKDRRSPLSGQSTRQDDTLIHAWPCESRTSGGAPIVWRNALRFR